VRRRTPAVRERFEREAVARRAIALPFWMAGDHFMFAWGRVNGRPPVLLFVDTGLAGGGFVCSDSAARSYGIDLSRATTSEGVGGAGKTQVTWFSVDSLSLGPATGRNIRGAVGALRFRESFGFDAGGIISHQFFRPFALTFDFDGMRLWLEPGPE
jgi:predicted aspartyl protease